MEKNIVYIKISNDYKDFMNIIKINKKIYKEKDREKDRDKNKNKNKNKNSKIKKLYYKINEVYFKIVFKIFKINNYSKFDNEKNEYCIFYEDIDKEKYKVLEKINKLIEKIYRKESKNEYYNIIISKEIKKIYYNIKNGNKEEIKNIDKILKKSFENKYLYKEFIEEIIESIIIRKNERIEEQSIYILLNSESIIYKNWIKNIAKKFKNINIVTENLNRFKTFEKNVEEECNLISIMNNKKKSLKRAKYIINIDFSDNKIKEYNINRDGILLNLSNNKIESIQGFNGYIINNIKMNNNDLIYDIEDVFCRNNSNYNKLKDSILNKIEHRKYCLIGNNSNIEAL